jgi:hypothetical protein
MGCLDAGGCGPVAAVLPADRPNAAGCRGPAAPRPIQAVWPRSRCGSGHGAVALVGALTVGGMGGFVVGHPAAQAVPQDLQPAVAERTECGVVALAAVALAGVALPGPGGGPQRAKRPVLDGFAEEVVEGQPAADDVFAAAGAAGDRGAAGVALQRVR